MRGLDIKHIKKLHCLFRHAHYSGIKLYLLLTIINGIFK